VQDIVLCSEEGLAVRIGGGPVMSLPWTEVTRVHAYRVDAVDSRPLIVAVEDDTGHAVELNPGMQGWEQFMERLAQLAGLSPAALNLRLDSLAINDEPATLYPRG
jgi:hypothetical protein